MSDKEFCKFIIYPVSRTLYFGSSLSIETGGVGYTRVLPPPSTLAGMIRGALLSEDPNVIFDSKLFGKEINGDYYYDFTGWRIIGPYLIYDGNTRVLYYPLPLLFLAKKEAEKKEIVLIKPTRDHLELLKGIDASAHDYILVPNFRFTDKGIEDLDFSEGFIKMEYLMDLLSGKRDEIEVKEEDFPIVILGSLSRKLEDAGILKIERTIGIGLDYKKKTIKIEEGRGHTYVTAKIALASQWKYFFAIIADEDVADRIRNALDGKILRLGGRGSLVEVKEVSDVEMIEEKLWEEGFLENEFLLYFTNPAVFSDDRGLDTFDLTRASKGALEVKAYAIKQTLISGWSIKKKMIRETHFGIEMGSSYFVKLKTSDYTYQNLLFDRFFVNEKYRGAFGSCLIGYI